MLVPLKRIQRVALAVAGAAVVYGLTATSAFSQMPLNAIDSAERARIKSDKLSGPLRTLVEQSNTSGNIATIAEDVGAIIVNGRVGVDILAAGDAAELARQLQALGAERVAVFGSVISAWVAVNRLEQVAGLANMRQIRMIQMSTRTGSVTSQGDVAMKADIARATNGVDGSGVVVGILSDSYDCYGDAFFDVESGDVPADVTILDDTFCIGAIDEGRAMAQIISDVAPGAKQAFHSAVGGQANFAIGIMELAEQVDADIIVDDVAYFAEPFFQDGIIAQAIDRVEAAGTTYFSAAGNGARDSHESQFRSSGLGVLWGESGDAHDFDPSENVDVFQQISIPPGDTLIITLQWDQPFASVSGQGSNNDLDFLLLDKDATEILAVSLEPNLGLDPVEILRFTNFSETETEFNLAIERYLPLEGEIPGKLKYVIFNGVESIDEYDTASSTVVGHYNAASTVSVGAVRYDATPAFGVSPPLREPFSSAGNTPILFDVRGNRVSVVRNKPDIMAPDGGNNTFFGLDYEGDLYPNFFGTSAAAPHAAGVAALMLEQNDELTPEQVRQRLIASAIDMADPGFDFDTGHGLIDATEALTQPGPATPQLSIEDIQVNEAAGSAAVRLVLDRTSSADVSVQVFSTSDSAVAGSDFYGTFSIVNIAAGSLSATIDFTIIDDAVPEPTEQFTVHAVNADGAIIARSQARVSILDNDNP